LEEGQAVGGGGKELPSVQLEKKKRKYFNIDLRSRGIATGSLEQQGENLNTRVWIRKNARKREWGGEGTFQVHTRPAPRVGEHRNGRAKTFTGGSQKIEACLKRPMEINSGEGGEGKSLMEENTRSREKPSN